MQGKERLLGGSRKGFLSLERDKLGFTDVHIEITRYKAAGSRYSRYFKMEFKGLA